MGVKKKIKQEMSSRKATAKLLAKIQLKRKKPASFEQKFETTIQRFIPREQQKNKEYINKLKEDMLFCSMYYGIDPEEYGRYQFEDLSDIARKRFVGKQEIVSVLKTLETPETRALFQDKFEAYNTFKKYYKREIIKVDAAHRDVFDAFCENHDIGIVKPYNSRQAMGVHKVSLKTSEQCEQAFQQIVEQGTCVVEEVINQGYEIAKFHPESVNTVRVITCFRDNIAKVVICTARFGTGDSIVDNHCISAGVDLDTGIIVTPAREAKKSGMHLNHPDTGYQIIGTKLPQWNELMNLMKELAQIVPEQRVVGWDMAYSIDGWVVVEGNTRPALQLLAGAGMGVRDIFEDITK
ncbi:MAG: sugar-transfer associated ATP-grasp domain-containing protein [Eubacteriales bacterium]|nr:sugar-transfer associated ATP-grasp domain-containing protein [Eubacteriales bacterium]